MRELDWVNPGRPAAPAEIRRVEEVIGHALPADVVELLSRHSGASGPTPSEFRVTDSAGEFMAGFGRLLEVDEGEVESIIAAWRNLQEEIPPGLVPIVVDGGGDFLLLDYRQGPIPSITYFAHELPEDEALLPVATSLTELIDRLTIPSDL